MFKNESNQIRAGWLIFLAFASMFIASQIFAIPGAVMLPFFDYSVCRRKLHYGYRCCIR